jgi:hypothetical protein
LELETDVCFVLKHFVIFFHKNVGIFFSTGEFDKIFQNFGTKLGNFLMSQNWRKRKEKGKEILVGTWQGCSLNPKPY